MRQPLVTYNSGAACSFGILKYIFKMWKKKVIFEISIPYSSATECWVTWSVFAETEKAEHIWGLQRWEAWELESLEQVPTHVYCWLSSSQFEEKLHKKIYLLLVELNPSCDYANYEALVHSIWSFNKFIASFSSNKNIKKTNRQNRSSVSSWTVFEPNMFPVLRSYSGIRINQAV